jgi:type IV pilus biogenesis protein CpaD/CtpE
MLARLTSALVVAALGAALLAGCGSSSSTSSESTPSSSTPTSPTTPTQTATAETLSVPKGATAARFVAACRATIAAEPRLEAPVKKEAERTCDAAEHASPEAALKAADEVCVQVVEALPLLEIYKQKLIKGCKARSR